VAQALWADDAVEPGARLDAIITLVDAAHFRAQLAEPQAAEAQLQVAYADVVVLNKTDLVVRNRARALARHARIALIRSLQPQSEADVAAVEAAVRGINAAATVVRAQRSVVDLDLILDVGTLSPAAGRLLLPPAAPAAPPQAAFARGAEKLMAASAAHDARVGTVCLSARGGLDEAQLRTWLVRRCCCVSGRGAHSLTTDATAGYAAVGARQQRSVRGRFRSA
jgi:G3E family GTPase